MNTLSARMQAGIAAVGRRRDKRATAIARLTAVGTAYLEFAHDEPGLFQTAFAVPDHLQYATTVDDDSDPTPFQILGGVLDELVTVGVLPAERRPDAEYPIWSAVHGMAVLSAQGPLRSAPDAKIDDLDSLVLAFIARAL
jgi:AcrR family transcriptional regulator